MLLESTAGNFQALLWGTSPQPEENNTEAEESAGFNYRHTAHLTQVLLEIY